jgi:hypothetical protein
MKFRQGKSQPLYIYTPDKIWLKIRDKEKYYRKSTINEIKGLILSQQLALINDPSIDERGRNRIHKTQIKLKKALASKVGESLKK